MILFKFILTKRLSGKVHAQPTIRQSIYSE